MKTKLMILAGLFLFAFSSAKPGVSDSEGKKETGIAFYQGTWEQALQNAKAEGKPVFLDVYASWCGPCKLLKARTFPNDKVGEFYNANFINVAVDGEKGEGIELARKYKVRGYPTLIFVDSSGNLIAKTSGYRNPKQFIELGKQIAKK